MSDQIYVTAALTLAKGALQASDRKMDPFQSWSGHSEGKQNKKKKVAVTRNQANPESNLTPEPGWAQLCSKQKIRYVPQETSFDYPGNKNSVLQKRYHSITSN
jgi:hypothetical protein